jgi:CRP/FNR family transcriptional regulator, cyclic AMP receptor protein
MPLADAVEAFEQEPRFAQYLAQLVSWRNQLLIDRLTLMRLGSPQLRVVMGLALFVQSFNFGNTNQLTSELADCQEIPLKQSLLASMCGVSRGVFSESVQYLASAGLIRLSYGTLALSRVRAWHKFSSDHSKNRHDNKMSMPAILKLMSESAPD